jgi:RNA polymerase-binding transcription factor DksA
MDDLTESASEDSQSNLDLATASATQEIVFEVMSAIKRIETGSFGTCEITGEPIEAERLNAIPWTRYSLQGQRELEKGRATSKSALPPVRSVVEFDIALEEPAEAAEVE